MLSHYLTLGLLPSASAEEIRRRYLDLVRAHPPSRDPVLSERVIAAYEALKDDRCRVDTELFGMARCGDYELALDSLVRARPSRRSTPALKALLAAEGLRNE